MPRNLTNLMDLARHAAGGPIDPRLDARELVNEAGEYVGAMHGWDFYRRPALTVDFVGGQDHVLLPDELGSVDGVEVASAVQIGVSFISMDRLNEKRSDELTTAEHYFAALEWPVAMVDSEAPPPPRLALWPTPPSNTTQALRIAWRAKWRPLVEGMDRPNLPADCEVLLIEVLRAIVRGSVEPDEQSVTERLDAIEGSSLVTRLKERYTRTQAIRGVSRNGVLASTRRHQVRRRFNRIAIASDP